MIELTIIHFDIFYRSILLVFMNTKSWNKHLENDSLASAIASMEELSLRLKKDMKVQHAQRVSSVFGQAVAEKVHGGLSVNSPDAIIEDILSNEELLWHAAKTRKAFYKQTFEIIDDMKLPDSDRVNNSVSLSDLYSDDELVRFIDDEPTI
jgi:hypothetical protein